jgi:hypothetical protein
MHGVFSWFPIDSVLIPLQEWKELITKFTFQMQFKKTSMLMYNMYKSCSHNVTMFNVPCQTKDRRGLVYTIMFSLSFYLLLAEIFGHLLKLGLGDEPVVVLVHHLQEEQQYPSISCSHP